MAPAEEVLSSPRPGQSPATDTRPTDRADTTQSRRRCRLMSSCLVTTPGARARGDREQSPTLGVTAMASVTTGSSQAATAAASGETEMSW